MNFPLLFQAMYFEPLCIEVATFHAAHAVVWPRIVNGRDLQGVEAAVGGQGGKPHKSPFTGRRATKAGPKITYQGWTPVVTDERFYYTPEGKEDVAVVPVYGILAKNAGFIEEACMGVTDINPAMTALHQASRAKDVKSIVIDAASPGGQTTGIREFAALVREAAKVRGKTVYVFCDERMASAMYWIGSQADEIYVTPSSTVGSIGTYLAWLDPSMKMAMEGLRLEFFGAGAHKGMGLPGKPLTEADRKLLQGKVEEINGWFKSDILAARPKVADSTMQGQTFSGEEAVKLKLADGIVGSWEEFIELI